MNNLIKIKDDGNHHFIDIKDICDFADIDVDKIHYYTLNVVNGSLIIHLFDEDNNLITYKAKESK